MRFLVDECVGPAVVVWLHEQKHDAFSVYEEARGLDDDKVIQKALDEDRIQNSFIVVSEQRVKFAKRK